jgi:type IV secretory pathway VirD2 relaxase
MSERDDFELWLGRIGDRGGGARERFSARAGRAAIRAGARHAATRAGRRFDGSRIGRGAGVGRLLGSGARGHDRTRRRVVVKTSIVRLGAKGLGRARAHLRYLQRGGTTRDGERATLYSAEQDVADGTAFAERGQGDRHQFRFIVAPEDGSEYEELKPLTRRLMDQAERDLGTRLDWVAVDHFDTGHPHVHVIVRGKGEDGRDLVIARDYLTQGLRERAAELVDLDLGPRTDREIAQANAREVEQERFTSLDRPLLRGRGADGLVDPAHRDGAERDLRVARLRRLEQMGLAEQAGSGRWRVHDELERVLRRMGLRGDIIRTMNRELRERLPGRAPQDQAIHEPGEAQAAPLIGRLVATGLSDEHADRRYLILDALDGRAWHVDIGGLEIDAAPGAVLEIRPRPVAARQVDRTVAEVAAANGGRYSVDLHLAHDRMASEAFAEAHIRRLEAIRRLTKGAIREPDGTWLIAADHVERAEAYERAIAARTPVGIETLSARPIERLPAHDGATWLDRELIAEAPAPLGRGFGAEVASAMEKRRHWLIAQGLAERDATHIRYRTGMLAELEQRELARTAAALSRELGKPFAKARIGEQVEGTLTRAVRVGDAKFALVEKSREFTLVPWRSVLERAIGREVAGIVREGGIGWTIGRGRGLSR